jgi:hypothetical protein
MYNTTYIELLHVRMVPMYDVGHSCCFDVIIFLFCAFLIDHTLRVGPVYYTRICS